MRHFDRISNLHDVCPHRSFRNGGRLCLETAVMKRWRLGLEVRFVQRLGVRMVVVGYDESWGRIFSLLQGGIVSSYSHH